MKNKPKSFLFFCLDLLGYKKGITSLNIFCNAIIFGRMAAISFCVRQVLNIIENSQGSALSLAVPYLIGIFIVILIRIAAIMGCAVLDALRSYYYQNRIRMNALSRLLTKDNINHVAGHSGPIFEVLSNDIPIATFPAELFTEVSGFFIYTLVALSMLLSINCQLTLFIFIPLSLAIYAIQRLSEAMKEKRHANRAAHDEASGFIADVTDAALAIKASGAEEPVLRRYDIINKNRRTAILKDSLLNVRIDVLLHGAVHLGSVIMMFAAARLMAGNSFGIGDFSLFIAHLDTLADCVSRIVELIAESRKAEVSYERILNVIGTEYDLNADAGITIRRYTELVQPEYIKKSLGSFEARNLSFDYGDGNGFGNVSFKIGPGELMVISGEVGSGKSTLLNVLMGLMLQDSGELLLDGRLLMANNRELVLITGSPSGGGFFSRDLKENLCLGFPASEDDMLRSLSIAALDEMVTPQNLSLDLGSRGSRLSGGQQQRLSLARMLLRGAELNVIDDCVSALDEETRVKFLHRLLGYLRETGHSTIIATNEETFIKAADHVLVMDRLTPRRYV
jgi:ABC-type multidrug transport system fused ATPase/permease subunit